MFMRGGDGRESRGGMRWRRKINLLLLLIGIFATLQLYGVFQRQWLTRTEHIRNSSPVQIVREAIASDSLLSSRPPVEEEYPPYPRPRPSVQTKVYNCDLPARVTADREPLFSQMDGDWHWDWIQQRITSLWAEWTNQTRLLEQRWTNHSRAFKRVLVLPGVLTLTSYAKPNVIKMGGALGDLVQWADLLAALHSLGHEVVIEYDIQRAAKNLNRLPSKTRCKYGGFDLIYLDILAAKALPSNVYNAYKCKLRVVDAYGTEAMYNDGSYATRMNYRSYYGRLGLNLRQFYTYYPHTPDNSFLGFVVSARLQKSRYVKKENISLLYTKNHHFLTDRGDYIRAVQEVLPVHATLYKADNLPDNVVNHGIVSFSEYQKLAKRAKICIGVGRPFESSGAMEAIARGSVFLNPRFFNRGRKPVQDLADYNAKPTTRRPTSQVPYLEEWVGPPHVYTLDITNQTEIRLTVQKILHNPVYAHIPREFTIRGFLERLNAYVEHQNFCDKRAPVWPPLDELRETVARAGLSCQKHCRNLGLICEPAFFPHLNSKEAFQRLNVTCRGSMSSESDVFLPAVRHDVTRRRHDVTKLRDDVTGRCVRQKRDVLYSCVGARAEYRRLCPCRNYIPEQIALCPSCL